MSNLLASANAQQDAFSRMMRDMGGYETITTFFMDFSIADGFGKSAIQETYNNAMNCWKDDYKFITELYIVLNHKIWQWYETNEDVARLYDKLWRDCGNYADEHFSQDELSYFYRIAD